MIYFNIKNESKVETIDQLEKKDFSSYREYKKELRRLIFEYRLLGMNVYSSQRSTTYWRKER